MAYLIVKDKDKKLVNVMYYSKELRTKRKLLQKAGYRCEVYLYQGA